jgi:nitrate reductase delta subunit
LATARQAASLLIGYPDEELLALLPLLRAAVAPLPAPIAGPLGGFLDHLETTPLTDQQVAYVETFDLRRRCSLYLTYYAYGDTRRRGMALLQFKHLYKRAGLELSDAELPDHLAVVLEFGATTDEQAAATLLTEHRAGLEVLRLALRDRGSPYSDALDVVSGTLPPLDGEGLEVVRRLVSEGPPAEEVGLDPYAPVELLPEALGGRR